MISQGTLSSYRYFHFTCFLCSVRGLRSLPYVEEVSEKDAEKAEAEESVDDKAEDKAEAKKSKSKKKK